MLFSFSVRLCSKFLLFDDFYFDFKSNCLIFVCQKQYNYRYIFNALIFQNFKNLNFCNDFQFHVM